MNLAARIAQAMADGLLDRLPRLTRHASPEFARDLLDAYYCLQGELQKLRRDEGSTWTLAERIVVSSMYAKLDLAIAHTRRWLTEVARRGGRGVPLQAPPVKESVDARA